VRRVVSKFVPPLLTQDQRDGLVAISQELLDPASEDENFLKRIIIGNETWVYGYNAETKIQSSLWVGKNSPRPKKARRVTSNVKVMTFFTSRGVVHHEFLRQGQTVNRWYYLGSADTSNRNSEEKKTSVVEKQLLVPPS
jgi:hypothetical protein